MSLPVSIIKIIFDYLLPGIDKKAYLNLMICKEMRDYLLSKIDYKHGPIVTRDECGIRSIYCYFYGKLHGPMYDRCRGINIASWRAGRKHGLQFIWFDGAVKSITMWRAGRKVYHKKFTNPRANCISRKLRIEGVSEFFRVYNFLNDKYSQLCCFKVPVVKLIPGKSTLPELPPEMICAIAHCAWERKKEEIFKFMSVCKLLREHFEIQAKNSNLQHGRYTYSLLRKQVTTDYYFGLKHGLEIHRRDDKITKLMCWRYGEQHGPTIYISYQVDYHTVLIN